MCVWSKVFLTLNFLTEQLGIYAQIRIYVHEELCIYNAWICFLCIIHMYSKDYRLNWTHMLMCMCSYETDHFIDWQVVFSYERVSLAEETP